MPLSIMRNEFVELLIYGLAVTRYIVFFQSLKIPERTLDIVKKTESDWLRILLAKAGMFFDCPLCLSLLSAIVAILINNLNHTINLLVAISVLGLFFKKKLLNI